jgi:hypothetical protein
VNEGAKVELIVEGKTLCRGARGVVQPSRGPGGFVDVLWDDGQLRGHAPCSLRVVGPSGEHALELPVPAPADTIPAPPPTPSPDDTWPNAPNGPLSAPLVFPATPIFDLWQPPPPSDLDAAARIGA